MSRKTARVNPGLLLKKQLSSISDTLAEAVKRRENDVRKRAHRPSISIEAATVPASTMPGDLGNSVSDLEDRDSSSLTPNTVPQDLTFSVLADPFAASLGNDTLSTGKSSLLGPVNNIFIDSNDFFVWSDDPDLVMPRRASDAHKNLDDTDGANGALDMMLQAGLSIGPSINVGGQIDVPAAASSLPLANLYPPGADVEAADSAEKAVNAETEVIKTTRSLKPATVQSSTSEEDDPTKMMAELERLVRSYIPSSSALVGKNDPKQITLEIEQSSATSAFAPLDADDPKQLLKDLEWSAATLKSVRSDKGSDSMENSRFRIEGFSNRLHDKLDKPNVFKKERKLSIDSNIRDGRLPKMLSKEVLPYAIALQLEKVVAWTKCLFNKAEQEKDAYIRKVDQDLNVVIQQVSDDENKRFHSVGKVMLFRRVVVTNIATDAGEEELAHVFGEFDMCEMNFLKEQHPINRTRAAYIDFYTQQSAWEASKVIEYIFCLKLRVRLGTDVF